MNELSTMSGGRSDIRRRIAAPGIDAPPAPFIGGDEDTRRRIRAQSRLLFERFGYAKTTIGEIAEACAMSPGNLYRHYRNKQAIGQAVVEEFVAEHAAEVQAALDAPANSAESRLRATLTAQIMFSIRHLRESPRLIELAEMLFATEEGRAMIFRLERQNQEMMIALIEDGVASGEFHLADPGAAAQATTLCLQFFNTPFSILRRGLDRVEEDLALALDLVCAGLRGGARG